MSFFVDLLKFLFYIGLEDLLYFIVPHLNRRTYFVHFSLFYILCHSKFFYQSLLLPSTIDNSLFSKSE